MKKRGSLSLIALILCLLPCGASPKNVFAGRGDWMTPEVSARGREPMHASWQSDSPAAYFEGNWKFRLSPNPDSRSTVFFKSSYDDTSWQEIAVPGAWEAMGLIKPVYLDRGQTPWSVAGLRATAPLVPDEGNMVGQYRRHFILDGNWKKGSEIFLHIGAASSNVGVWVNGKEVGYGEDSHLESCFNITDKVKNGMNVLALEVFRWCDGSYLEAGDGLSFSGITGKVWIESRPKKRLENLRIMASMDGSVSIDGVLSEDAKSVTYRIVKNGITVLEVSSKDGKAQAKVDVPKLWSAESPELYRLEARVAGSRETLNLDFGFRDVKIDGGQLLVNGRPVLLKGVNRVEHSLVGGPVLTEEEMIRDIKLMKSLNINAVRCCGHPCDPRWYSLCDKYGLYVIDEADIVLASARGGHGVKAFESDLRYEDAFFSRASRMAQRDFNHPCIIAWSLGDGSAFGHNFIYCYQWLKRYDPTRPVQYAGDVDNFCSDISCPEYYTPFQCEGALARKNDKPLILSKYANASGNSLGGLEPYWKLSGEYPSFQGGFIWNFADLSSDVPEVPASAFSGIVAADRTCHSHAWEVAWNHRPILTYANPDEVYLGLVHVFNDNFFTGLEKYRLHWELCSDGETVKSGDIFDLDVPPREERLFNLGYDALSCIKQDKDLYLKVEFFLKGGDALLPEGHRVAWDQMPIYISYRAFSFNGGQTYVEEFGDDLVFFGKNNKGVPWEIRLDEKTGAFYSYVVGGVQYLSSPMVPCFGRALTQKDASFVESSSSRVWLYPDVKLSKLSLSPGARLRVVLEYKDIADVEMIYYVNPDASIEVEEHLCNVKTAAPLMRVGVELAMPLRFDTIDYYGRGPFPNYPDRRSSALLGHYVQDIAEQFDYSLVRPQESSLRTDVRYLRIVDFGGRGLEFASTDPFCFSALPFARDYYDSFKGGMSSSSSLKRLNEDRGVEVRSTFVNLDLRHTGVGYDQDGNIPEAYVIPSGEYRFKYTIRPL